MRGARLLIALLLAPVLAGCFGSPEEGEPPAPALAFDARGCREHATGVYADRARVEALLPPGLALEDPLGPFADYARPGKALLYLTVIECDEGSVRGPEDESPVPVRFRFAAVYTAVKSPPGSGANGSILELALHATDPAASARYAEAGWPAPVATVTLTRASGPGAGDVNATWSGPGFRYALDATSHAPTAAGEFTPLTQLAFREVNGTLRRFTWQVGDGTVAVTGSGRLTMSPGSPLADLLQATETEAFVVTSTFTPFSGALPAATENR